MSESSWEIVIGLEVHVQLRTRTKVFASVPWGLGFLDAGGVQRNSFYEAGLEDAISRVYGGVHIREACEDSFAVGLNVGAAVVQDLWANT